MPTTFQPVRAFLSSTFRDMHAGRDWLNRIVCPELRNRCQRRGVEFVGVVRDNWPLMHRARSDGR